jgi:ABC-2 type transport system permease protein
VTGMPPLNPVLARELKQRMRGRLTWVVITVYLGVLAVILRFVYLGASRAVGGDGFGNPLAAAAVGRSIFQWLLFFMLMLVCFIVPGLTAAAISGERERQTLVSLQLTLLRPRSIVVGKVLASLAFVTLLIVASLPLVSVPFLVGGVSVGEVAKGIAMVLLTAVALAAVAVACSALLRRTQAATVMAYGLTLCLVIGTFVVYGAQRALDGPIDQASPTVLVLNPFVATADVVGGRSDGSLGSPFTGLRDLLVARGAPVRVDAGGGAVGVVGGGFARVETEFGPTAFPGPGHAVSGGPMVAEARPVPLPPPDVFVHGGPGAEERRAEVAGISFWVASVLAFAALSAAALGVAVHRIALPSSRQAS